MTQNKALAGIRVLDLGMFWAGPYAGKLLGDFGAEVIKVESVRRPDPLRVQARGIYPNGEPGERPWNRSGLINERNRSKLGLSLDLSTPPGAAVFKRLVRLSDVVLENYSVNVMTNFGLDYAALNAVNPGIIMISIASQGISGPEKDYVSFGNTLEQTGGLAYITGYPGESPYYASGAYPDAISGIMAAGAIVSGLRTRRWTGEGLHLELSQRELVTHFLGEMIVDYSMNQRVWEPMGNRDWFRAPHGCYRCAGTDQWVTIAVSDDKEWASLCSVTGKPELVADPRFATVLGRYRNQDELDVVVEEWTSQREPFEVMQLLQAVGIAAGPVLAIPDLLRNTHLEAREFFEVSTHPEAGSYSYYSRPMKLTKTPGVTTSPAPCFGEHNEYLLGEVLGIPSEEIEQLEMDAVIGKVPQSLLETGD